MQVMDKPTKYDYDDNDLRVILKNKTKDERNVLIHKYLVYRIDYLEGIVTKQRKVLEKLTDKQFQQIIKLIDVKLPELHIQKLKEQSRKNAEELRKLVGLPMQHDQTNPKMKIKGLLAECADEIDEDSLKILKSAREKDE